MLVPVRSRGKHVNHRAGYFAEPKVRDSAAPLRDAKGVVQGSVVVFADVSERRKLEAQVAAGRMAAVGTLAARVAHEIHNPLTAVLLGLDLACTWLPESSACLRNAESVMSADMTGMEFHAELLTVAPLLASRVVLLSVRTCENRGGDHDGVARPACLAYACVRRPDS